MSAPDRLLAALGPALVAAPAGRLGVAVSGGGDSVALLHLLHAWGGRPLAAITVDHGLRPESAAEAERVAALCARLGVPHAVRAWRGPGLGNLQDAARRARRALIADWTEEEGVAAVALGHTLDDQAETFLLRLARGSGVDGLSGMAAVARQDGVLWLRPLLGLRRAELRAWLRAEGVGWDEDPSNADARFDRVRARAALTPLADLGLGPARLAATAARMARARAALDHAASALAASCLRAEVAGDLTLDPGPYADAPLDLRLRLLATALCWVSGAVYRPRLTALEAALAALDAGTLGRGITLHGCVLRPQRGRIAIRREPARVGAAVPLARGRWDGRWQFLGRVPDEGLWIGALGDRGIARHPGWRSAGIARETLVTTPALWRGDELAAAPLLRPGPGIGFRRVAAVEPLWPPADSALNPEWQTLC